MLIVPSGVQTYADKLHTFNYMIYFIMCDIRRTKK